MTAKMDIIKVDNNLTKLKFYRISESNNFDNIKKHLNEMLSNYSSSNVNLLKDNVTEITNKFYVIKKIHYSNNIIIITNLNTYINTSRKVSKNFDNIR